MRPDTEEQHALVEEKRAEFVSEILLGKPAAAALLATLAIAFAERRGVAEGAGALAAAEAMLPVLWQCSLALAGATAVGLGASYAA